MRLSYRLTKYFTVIVFISLTFGFFVFYFAIERANIQSIISKLENLNSVVENSIKKDSQNIYSIKYPYTQVKILGDEGKNLTKESINEGNYEWNEDLQSLVHQISVTTYPFINGKHYQIQSKLPLPIIDNEFFVGIVMVVAWIFVFIIITIIFFGELITRKLYTPFFHLLEQMKAFDVRDHQKLEPMPTTILEFANLNTLFLKTSEQSVAHYNALKEFTQNLSHELQTPMANMKGKIEILLNSPLSENQMMALSSIYDELDRVSSINRSLILLMSLDHHKVTDERINFSEILHSILPNFEDLMMMNDISFYSNIKPNVYIKLNPLLANLIVNNLVSNAIKHNIQNGKIEIDLNDEDFIIKNTGHEQEFTNESIYNRFTKGKNNSQSIGIGLALVKKVVTVYGYEIRYSYDGIWHLFKIKLVN